METTMSKSQDERRMETVEVLREILKWTNYPKWERALSDAIEKLANKEPSVIINGSAWTEHDVSKLLKTIAATAQAIWHVKIDGGGWKPERKGIHPDLKPLVRKGWPQVSDDDRTTLAHRNSRCFGREGAAVMGSNPVRQASRKIDEHLFGKHVAHG
jgi:uncharacterized protein (UPF0147 family)